MNGQKLRTIAGIPAGVRYVSVGVPDRCMRPHATAVVRRGPHATMPGSRTNTYDRTNREW
jgi:hypothetical protein